MNTTPGFSRATHLSIIWGVTLAILTVMEWRNLDRDPLGHQVMMPFIERDISMSLQTDTSDPSAKFAGNEPSEAQAGDQLRYEVEFGFNGPLFLACFFGPVLAFQGIGLLAARARSKS